jgi:diguanylate cyclase (GGDEF)-like protein
MLKSTVDLLREYVRESDVFFRYGGDEFVLGFNNSSSEGVSKLMDVANKRLEEKFEMEDYSVRFSYGVYSYDGQEKSDVKFILDEADKRMYINKNNTKEIRFNNEQNN